MRHAVVGLVGWLVGGSFLYGQFFGSAYEWHWIHFGISLGVNFHSFAILPSEQIWYDDTVVRVESGRAPGIHIGIISDVRLVQYVHLRFIPTVALSDHLLLYETKQDTVHRVRIQSTYAWFPLFLAVRSEPIGREGRIRLMLTGGVLPYVDLLSNARAQLTEGEVRVYPEDLGIFYGVGIEFLLETFTLGIKVQWYRGVRNLFVEDRASPYTRTLAGLWNKGFLVSVHFE